MRHQALCRAISSALLAASLALCTLGPAGVASAAPPPDMEQSGSNVTGWWTGDELGPAKEPWRYGTYYLFPLTRHLGTAGGVSRNWRYPLYPLTVAFDAGQLPFGAIAGLFGE